MATIKPEAFIAIEEAMGSALTTEWARSLSDTISQLYDLLGQRRWYAAHALIDTIDLNTVVESSREQVEELSVSALLFGASHASGSVGTTTYTQGGKALPQGLQQAIDQLDISLKYTIAEEMRWELHRVVTELEEQQKYAILHKDDMSLADLVTAGLATPDMGLGKQTLYVHRPLVNTAQLLEWAKAQGFPSTLEQDDFHVTVCFSRAKLDWNAVMPDVPEVIAIGGKREVHKFGKAVVLTFQSVELEERHEEFKEAGASHDFEDYRPHVSITYAGTDFDISKIEPYDDELIFGPEEFAPLKEDWAGTITERKLVKAETMTLAQRLNAAVLENKALIDVNANLTTSRLVALGFLSEAVERDITTYQVNEVLDDRTCDVCAMMHGKTFNVVQEYSKIMTALQTTDPQELRNVAPWPKNTKAGLAQLNDMSEDEMQLAGYGSPPYHPRCRGFLVKVGTVTEKTKMREPSPTEVLDAGPVLLDVNPTTVLAEFEKLKEAMTPTSYSAAEIAILDQYTGNAHYSMNQALRRGFGQDRDLKKYLKAQIKEMDAALSRATLQESTVMYRGVQVAKHVFDTDDLATLVGKMFSDKGFISTTADAAYAADIAGKIGAVFEITIPPGIGAALPEAIAGVMVTGERELILERGLVFKIVQVDLSGVVPKIKAVVVSKLKKAEGADGAAITKTEANRFAWEAGDIKLHK